ncbi:hypothetical protein PLESTB_000482300 [Pleodorina starrii]|uniref:PPIase cyclophilin-type domain-containing protein n=1 Tax=Pleodorina starrii TaxID=330485 RepID=A0A9W6BGB2_9CHLO|nr:hypothetical protein PLESTM_001584100 [Pleodorina starrii]GLC51250.1 hypothetical protein PLESTB_000482300 [Pleodorina starrii]GLC63609.1 hypothetical protein PLESTF_000054700 [Pleodorina starrii]
MAGFLLKPSSNKLGLRKHARAPGSPSGSSARVVAARCRADAAHAPTGHPQSQTTKNIDRRQVLSALLTASGALLLPSRPSLAEDQAELPLEASPSPGTEAAPAVAKTELVAQAPTAAASDATAEAVALPDGSESPEPSPAASAATEPSTSGAGSVAARGPQQVFMDVTINGEPAGRITIQLFAEEVPEGARRFAELAAGRQGVDYRLSKFNGVLPTYIRNDGLNRLSYSANEVSPIAAGDSLDAVEAELDRQTRRHDQAGLVSLVVREREARPVKERLVARDGRLITVLEQAGEAPNGTQFTITTAASPDLDATNLIIGRLVGGQELLQRISALPVNRPRNDNPYFQAGKAMGDKRAVTAERAFYRPFQKVVVSSSGVIS